MKEDIEFIKKESLVVSVKELACLLNASVRHIWRLSASGSLPKPIHLGKSVRWLRSEIEAWLEAGTPKRTVWERMKQDFKNRSAS